MPRRKLSEYRAKKILYAALELAYIGWEIDAHNIREVPEDILRNSEGEYVVKVDQGVKGRFKKGLVLLHVKPTGISAAIEELSGKGYRWLLIEPSHDHKPTDERYLAVDNSRDGFKLTYSQNGGIDVESNNNFQSAIEHDKKAFNTLINKTGITKVQIEAILLTMKQNHISFLEINPYIHNGDIHMLDAAMEVDDAGNFFTNEWTAQDFRELTNTVSKEELTTRQLNEKSSSSFKLEVINPNGAIFLLLSGGGASIVVADTVMNKKLGHELANYGEYSGNPNAEETQIYTEQVLKLLINSKATRKVLYIGGAVANFTDIATTFTGVIKALENTAPRLQKQAIKVFVRRGGPHQEIGLERIERTLDKLELKGAVSDNSVSLATSVNEALEWFTK